MELKDLEKMTVVKLREEAAKFEDLKGVHGMHKDQLIEILCQKLGIHRPEKKVVGIDKAALKQRIRALKSRREKALAARDHQELAEIRMRIKRYKRMIKEHMVTTA